MATRNENDEASTSSFLQHENVRRLNGDVRVDTNRGVAQLRFADDSIPEASHDFNRQFGSLGSTIRLHSKNLCMDDDVDLQDIASSTNGYVGADLQSLCSEASRLAYRRMLKTGIYDNIIKLKMDDWEYALSMQHPSITKGVTKEIAKVTWDDIGGLKDIKEKLKVAVEWPIKYADAFARLGISPVSGVLLHGFQVAQKPP